MLKVNIGSLGRLQKSMCIHSHTCTEYGTRTGLNGIGLVMKISQFSLGTSPLGSIWPFKVAD